MSEGTLSDLQVKIQDKSAFGKLDDFYTLCDAFLAFIRRHPPTRIVSLN